MKYILTLVVLGMAGSFFAQKDFTPSNRKKAFGTVDRRNLRLTGLQVELGPAFTCTSLKTINGDFNNGGSRGNFEIDPKGRFGGYVDIGLAHYLKNPIALGKPEGKQVVLFNMMDWGLGFKYIGGKEETTINYTDIGGNVTLSDDDSDKFFNGYLTARFSLHRSFTPKKWEKFFFDSHIGFNVDYRLITADQESNYHTNFVQPYSPDIQYHRPLVAQMHLGGGLGFKARKGTNLFLGLRAPVLGMYEWNKGNPAQAWYSSNYFPLFLHLKVINLFQKRSKGSCNGTEATDEDRRKNEEFMQGN